MAHHHARSRTVPQWATRPLKAGRKLEAAAERYWALLAFTLASLGTGAYVVAQLAHIA
jgi:hypothetical protein